MKYDEKTGKKVPECRGDEIKLSFEELSALAKKSGGTFDRQVEVSWLLRDIDQSMALIVDMLGLLMGKLMPVDEEKPEDKLQ